MYRIMLLLSFLFSSVAAVTTVFSLNAFTTIIEANKYNFWIEKDLWYLYFIWGWVNVFLVFYFFDILNKKSKLWKKIRIIPAYILFLVFTFDMANDLIILYKCLYLIVC